MTLIRVIDIPQNGYIGVQLPQPAIGVRIENLSNATVSLKDDLGRETDIAPPGFTLGWLHPEGLYSPQIGCVGYYQGNARCYLYDSEIDISQNPNTQQPGGVANMSAATLEGLVTQLINLNTGLNTLIGTTNTNTGNTNTNVASLATLINTTNALDTDIRTYIDALRGILPQSVTQLVFTGVWQEQSIGPLAHSTDQLSIAVIYPPPTGNDGFLWIYYTYGGTRVYLEEKTYWFFAGGQQTPTLPTWITYDEKIPANATVVVGSDSSSTILVKL